MDDNNTMGSTDRAISSRVRHTIFCCASVNVHLADGKRDGASAMMCSLASPFSTDSRICISGTYILYIP